MKFRSGIKEVDNILSGGFSRGTLSVFFSEGDFSGKTTTLSFLARNSANAGNSVGYISFDENVETMQSKIPYAKVECISLIDKPSYHQLEVALANMKSNLVFIDNLTNLELFVFNPEAISVVHNLRTIAMYTQKAIVCTIGILPSQDVMPLLRMCDVAFDIERYENSTFTLGVLKNKYGSAGGILNFGVHH